MMAGVVGPWLYLDAAPACILNGRKQVRGLSSSFVDSSWFRAFSGARNLRKQRRNRGLVVVNELAGQYEENYEDVKNQIVNYFTYKAVRTVLHQLYEMNPTKYRWFYNYIAANEHGYGKRFIRNLVKDKQDLAERVMVTRLHLYGRWIKELAKSLDWRDTVDNIIIKAGN